MRVVFAAAIMDLLHHGHINLLREMRVAGDKVIVVLHDDASCYRIKGKIPVQNLRQRKANVRITGLADMVLTVRSTDPGRVFERVIRRYRRHDLLYMRGDDLTEDFPGRWALDHHGVAIRFVPYTKDVSSTRLRDQL